MGKIETVRQIRLSIRSSLGLVFVSISLHVEVRANTIAQVPRFVLGDESQVQ